MKTLRLTLIVLFLNSFCFGGGSYTFDGATGFINYGNTPNISGAFTVAAWIKPATVALGTLDMVNSSSAGDSQDFTFELNRTAAKLTSFWGNAQCCTSNTALVVNKWQHVALVRGGTAGAWTWQFYLNGIPDGNGTDATNPNGSFSNLCTGGVIFAIGALCNTGTTFIQFFNGSLADVTISSRAMTQADILETMNCGSSNFKTTTFYFPLRDTKAAFDYGPQQIKGTITGTVTPSLDGPPISNCAGGL